MSKFCIYCGKEMDDTANNCPACGALQKTSSKSVNKSLTEAAVSLKNKPSLLKFCAIGVPQ